MTIATYDDLKASVADFLNREDLTAVIPTFIRLAESRLDRELRHWKQTKRVTVSLSTQYNDVLPPDFLQPVRLQLTDGPTGEVTPISVAQMLQLREDRNDRAGRPTNYALTAEELEIYPTPDAAYNASLVYFARTTPLATGNQTNWLLTEAPDAYLYGSLLHAAPYLKDDARLAVWESLYKLASDALTTSSDDARFGGTGLRMKTRR
jgi:hypothetical protein